VVSHPLGPPVRVLLCLPPLWFLPLPLRQGYFKAIKAAKKAYWKSLRTSATPQSIWAVKKIAAGSPTPASPIFRVLRLWKK